MLFCPKESVRNDNGIHQHRSIGRRACLHNSMRVEYQYIKFDRISRAK